MSLSDPFAKKKQIKTESNQHKVKKDVTRENVKKSLLQILEPKTDENSKFSAEKISLEIEEEIFKQNNNVSQCKCYREKIRKIELRIKGVRNLFVREILKKGLIDIKTFCELEDKVLNDDNYFKNLIGENSNNNQDNNNNDKQNISSPSKGNSNINRIGKIPMRTARPPVVKMNMLKFEIPKNQDNKDNYNIIDNQNLEEEEKKKEEIKEIKKEEKKEEEIKEIKNEEKKEEEIKEIKEEKKKKKK